MTRLLYAAFLVLLALGLALGARWAWRHVEQHQLAWYCRVHGLADARQLSRTWRQNARVMGHLLSAFLAFISAFMLVNAGQVLLGG